MQGFWNGFEKRALSHELLSRAGTKALQDAETLVRLSGRLKGEAVSTLLQKRIRQGQKFHSSAAGKAFKKGLQKGDMDAYWILHETGY